ncbi:hypothetical protein Syun_024411 [Stephania yunnanensis]|uniref:F-box domain-containing protein n=1 Tax=Stephania yunnanensis TaxID=152371 RepID=A0AAP0NJ40_9MAGN
MGVTASFAAMSSWVDGCKKDILNVFCDDGSICIFEKSRIFDGFDGCAEQNGKELELNGCVLCSEKLGIGESALNSCRKDYGNGKECCRASRKESEMGSVSCSDGNEVDPSDVLPFCFSFLGVQDLLAMESVCKSLRFAAQNDVLPWRSIHINKNLSERITDDTLLLLSNKAQGHLHSLSLVDCWNITNNGLKSVLDSNPRLTQLNVSGCIRITVGGIISILKAFKSSAAVGIKRLRIGERYGMTQEHFAELKSLIVAEECLHPKTYPHFYVRGHSSLSFEDDRSIDVEVCPKCQNVTLVYDCPTDSCPWKQSDKQPCKGCRICIPRCIQCARCIRDIEYEETFCLELLCIDCRKKETSTTLIISSYLVIQ